MRTYKLELRMLIAAVALAFLLCSPSVICADESGGLLRLIFGGSDGVSTAEVAQTPRDVRAAAETKKTEKTEEIDKDDPRAIATHEQVAVIKTTTGENKSKLPLHDFCLDADGNILAAVGGEPGEVRIFDPEGKQISTWNVSVKVEAIGIGPDGSVYVGGSGKLLKLDRDGKVVIEVEAPHVATLKNDAEKIREQIIKQHAQQLKMVERQVETYKDRIKMLEEKIEKQAQELKAESKESEDGDDESEGNGDDDKAREEAAKRKQYLKQRLTRDETMLRSYQNNLKSMEEYAKQAGGEELTEEQIEAQVKAMIAQKQHISSVSAAGGDVFVTSRATVGYSFDVWRTDEKFEGAKKIVEGLSGCCGQMDAQAGSDGLFVAENSRHRVCRYDRDGKLTANWGKGARKGLVGFGGCCNPKNVAFGPNNEVYTVEDTNGRIKRYSPDGKLLGLVGTAAIGRGCLDIAVAVSKDGDRVYMLDTDANHIVLLKPKKASE